QARIVGKIDERVLLAADALRAHEASAELAKIHFGIDVAGENADAKPRNIHPFGYHVHRDDPRVAGARECADAARGAVFVGNDDLRIDADALAHEVRDETRVLLVHRDGQTARLRMRPAKFEQFAVRLDD